MELPIYAPDSTCAVRFKYMGITARPVNSPSAAVPAMEKMSVPTGMPDSLPAIPQTAAMATVADTEGADTFGTAASSCGTKCSAGSSRRVANRMMAGNIPTPPNRRKNCMKATAAPSAPISAAMIGVSLIPPGTAQKKDVIQSNPLVA